MFHDLLVLAAVAPDTPALMLCALLYHTRCNLKCRGARRRGRDGKRVDGGRPSNAWELGDKHEERKRGRGKGFGNCVLLQQWRQIRTWGQMSFTSRNWTEPKRRWLPGCCCISMPTRGRLGMLPVARGGPRRPRSDFWVMLGSNRACQTSIPVRPNASKTLHDTIAGPEPPSPPTSPTFPSPILPLCPPFPPSIPLFQYSTLRPAPPIHYPQHPLRHNTLLRPRSRPSTLRALVFSP